MENLLRKALLTTALTTQFCLHAHEPQRTSQHAFVENLGQWADPFLYRADLNGATLFVENDGWTWTKLEERAGQVMHDMAHVALTDAAPRLAGHAWRMRFIEASPGPQHRALAPAPHHRNYFLGNDPSRWKGNVQVYRTVLQEAVWPGVDVELSTIDGNFKYDIHLGVGADAGQIALAYEGLDGLFLNREGSLRMSTAVGDVVEMAPVAFYRDGSNERLKCAFVLEGMTLRFSFPEGYDASRPVVIDPLLIAATYSGASGASTYGHCATYDNEGNIYTGGRNFGPVYPATLGAFQTEFAAGGTDIALSKYNPDGSELIWASYLGGTGVDNPHSLITNGAGELIVLGSTSSSDDPITAGAFDTSLSDDDITVTHFAFDGSSLIGSTFLGGSEVDGINQMGGNYGETYRGEVNLDAMGNILIASFSSSSDFPTSSGALQTEHGGGQDAVVVKLDPACSQLLASSYFGGSEDDNAMGIRVASNGDLYIVGSSDSSSFTMPPGAYMATHQGGGTDGYVIRVSSDLTSMIAGTYFGTDENDRIYFVDLDSEERVWVYGQTEGDIPIFPEDIYGAPGGEVFLAKLTPDLTAAPFTTMIPGELAPVAFVVDLCDRIYISGYEASGDLPITPDALYASGAFYLAVFDEGLADIRFGTHYGGGHVDGGTSRFDKNGIIYQAVCSGEQIMQSTAWAYAPVNQNSWDIGVFKIDMEQCDLTTSLAHRGFTEEDIMRLWLANDHIGIDLPGSMLNASVSIYDATGRLVQSGNAVNSAMRVDVSHLPNGAYQVVATSSTETLQGRFVYLR